MSIISSQHFFQRSKTIFLPRKIAVRTKIKSGRKEGDVNLAEGFPELICFIQLGLLKKMHPANILPSRVDSEVELSYWWNICR